MRRVVAVVLLSLLGCGASEPAPAPAPLEPIAAPVTSDAAPATSTVAQPTAEERRRAEAIAGRFVASFDEVEQAFAGGKVENTPLLPIVGDGHGATWVLSGERLFEALPESRPWSTVVGMLGGPPDASFTLAAQRLEVGIYRTPAEGSTSRRRAGLALFRILRDELVLEEKRDGVVSRRTFEIATAGVFLPDARVDELLRPQPTPEERRDAEALAERFAAAFDQVEQAFARGEMECKPLDAVRGVDHGPVWSMSGTDLIETPRRPGQPESVPWCTVMGMLGGTLPDVAFTLAEQRLEVGVYRTDAAGPLVRPAGIVLFRVMQDLPGESTHDSVVDADGKERVVAMQQLHQVATAGVHVSNARMKELVGGR